jgi:hypothetical protein
MGMTYAKILPSFWTGATGRSLRQDVNAQVVALYLMTSPHANGIGVFRCPIEYIQLETGLPINGVSKGLAKLCEIEFCTVDPMTETVWVHEMAYNQLGAKLTGADNRVAYARRCFEEIENLEIKRAFFKKYGVAYHLQEPTDVLEDARPAEGAPKPLLSSLEANITTTSTIRSVPSERAPLLPVDQEKQLFDRGKQILGKNAGGQIAKLRAAKGGSTPLARAAIEQASAKENPSEYIAAVIRGGTGPPSFARKERPNGGFTALLLQQKERMNGPVTIDHDDREFASSRP